MATDLVTLSQARSFLQKTSSSTSQDAEISNEISRASAAIMRYTEREFVTSTVGSVARIFETELGLDGYYVDFAPWDAQTVTAVVIDTDQGAGYTLSTDEYRVAPANKQDAVYTGLRLRPLSRAFGRIMYRQVQVTVTGTWGWPSVPLDVQQACLVTVATWMRRDVQGFERVLKIDEGTVERPNALPSAVMGMLAPYKRCAI